MISHIPATGINLLNSLDHHLANVAFFVAREPPRFYIPSYAGVVASFEPVLNERFGPFFGGLVDFFGNVGFGPVFSWTIG